MFLELIATFFAGFGAAGIVLLINIVTKGSLPKWAMPVAAGAAMIGLTISNEYTWGTRTEAQLPDGLVAFDEVDRSDWYRPWSYIAPITYRLVAVAPQSVETRPDVPDVKLVDIFLFERWQPQLQARQLVRCSEPAWAIATPPALENPADADWQNADQRLIEAVC